MSLTSSSYPVSLASGGSALGKVRPASSPTYQVLVVDAEGPILTACRGVASRLGMFVHTAKTFAEAQAVLLRNAADLLLLDLDLTGLPGLRQLEGIRASHPEMGVVIITAKATVQSAVAAMRLGASDFLTAPIGLDELTQVLERASMRTLHDAEAKALHRNLTHSTGMGRLVGRSLPMEKVYRMISKVAFANHPVLILGESGVGKELIARTIHEIGPRAGNPFLSVYCHGAADELERDLFGYARGALLSAKRHAVGQLVKAESGTVFLHGIDELPPSIQAKLVRVLGEREVRAVDGQESLPIHARIIASASPAIVDAQAKGLFRKDLFFRLNIINIRVPSLKDRPQDIPLLTDGILRRIRQETGVPYELDSEMRDILLAYDWPGNVRELESALEGGCLMGSGPYLTASDLSTQFQQYRQGSDLDHRSDSALPPGDSLIPKSFPLTSIARIEKDAILTTLQHLQGDKLKAAKLLGIGKTTLYRKLKKYDIEDAGPL